MDRSTQQRSEHSPAAAAGSLSICSSTTAAAWRADKDPNSFEWWYFDAASDDGREAVVVAFLDSFVFSPQPDLKTDKSRPQRAAVSFVYCRDGRPVYRSVEDFPVSEFTASADRPFCRIGKSGFELQAASYGTGYRVNIEASLGRGRRLQADLEWLSIESDLLPDVSKHGGSSHNWNLVAPRSDVTGRINVCGKNGLSSDLVHFRGTGYHDHNVDSGWMSDSVRDWHRGRAHFSDCTAVFCRYRDLKSDAAGSRLLLVRDGKLEEKLVRSEEQSSSRHRLGSRYPARMSIASDDGIGLKIRPIKVIDSSLYHLRFLNEMELDLADGKPRTTTGISEFIAPRTLRYRWLNWITNIRIRRNGRDRPSP